VSLKRLFLIAMRISNSNWCLFLTSLLIFQLVLSSYYLIDYHTKFSHFHNETIIKQLDSNSQAIEETESLVEVIEETSEEIVSIGFKYNLVSVLNFSSKSSLELKENSNSNNFSLIPYSPPKKIS